MTVSQRAGFGESPQPVRLKIVQPFRLKTPTQFGVSAHAGDGGAAA